MPTVKLQVKIEMDSDLFDKLTTSEIERRYQKALTLGFQAMKVDDVIESVSFLDAN